MYKPHTYTHRHSHTPPITDKYTHIQTHQTFIKQIPQIHTHTLMRVHMHPHTLMLMHVHTCTHTHTRSCVCTNVHTHTLISLDGNRLPLIHLHNILGFSTKPRAFVSPFSAPLWVAYASGCPFLFLPAEGTLERRLGETRWQNTHIHKIKL